MKGEEIILSRKYMLSLGSYGKTISTGAYPATCKRKDPGGREHLFVKADDTEVRVPSRQVLRRWNVADDAEYETHRADKELADYGRKIKADRTAKAKEAATQRGARAVQLLELLGIELPVHLRNGTGPPVRGNGETVVYEAWVDLPASAVIELCEASVLLRRHARVS